jgi:chromosome segregation ATPase
MLRVSALIAAISSMRLSVDKERPVNRVINLLKEMSQTLEKEAEEDQEIYDKLSCWCRENDSEKNKAVADAQAAITRFTAAIEELSASSADLAVDIKKTREDLAANKESLDKATAARRKDSGVFTKEEQEMIQAVSALKGAITVLKRHNSLSQVPSESLAQVRKMMNRYRDMVPSQRQKLTAFLSMPTVQSYDNQSGEIFGILEQMLENFESNLSDAQKEELQAVETYNALRAAKEDEIAAGKARLDHKLGEKADTDNKLADTKEDLEDTTNTLSEDQKFLMKLKKRCKEADEEFAERTTTRRDEIAAVSETINILTNDMAHDKMGDALGFIQISERQRRAAAAKVLRATGNPILVSLAVQAKLDAFKKVKKAIDDMISQLKKEKEDEIIHRDWCNQEFASNEQQTAEAQRLSEGYQNKIEDLKTQIETLTKEMKALRDEITEMHVQLKRASEDRKAENMEFQKTIVDQRDTQEILKKAINRLQQFYDKKAANRIALVQAKDQPQAPEGFKEYKKNQGASGVLGMIQEIINDSKRIEAESEKAEQDAQSAYEEFVQETNSGVAQRQRTIVNKTSVRAEAEEEKASTEGSLRGTLKELEKLSNYNGDLHQSCDFTLKNFEVRQDARDKEVEALQQAKSILSGADLQ